MTTLDAYTASPLLTSTTLAVTVSYVLPVVIGALLLRTPPCLKGPDAAATWTLPAAGAPHYSQAFLTATGAVTGAGVGGDLLARLSPLGLALVALLMGCGAVVTITWSTWLLLRWCRPPGASHPAPAWSPVAAAAAAWMLSLTLLGTALLWPASDAVAAWTTRLAWCGFHALAAVSHAGLSLPPPDHPTLVDSAALPVVVGPLVLLSGLGLPVYLAWGRRIRARRAGGRPTDDLDAHRALARHARAAVALSLILFLLGGITMTGLLSPSDTAPGRGLAGALADGGTMAMTARSAGLAPRRADQM